MKTPAPAEKPAIDRRRSTANGTRPRGEVRRHQILGTAVALFSSGGFNNVSLADIAEEVGITQAGILHYFPTKAALLIAVLQEREARNREDERARKESGMDFLSTFMTTLEENEQNPVLVQLFAVLSAESIAEDHPGHDWFTARYDKTVASMTQGIQPLLDVEKLPPGIDAETIARWLIGLADGLRIQWLLSPGKFDRHQLVQQFLRVINPYLRRPS